MNSRKWLKGIDCSNLSSFLKLSLSILVMAVLSGCNKIAILDPKGTIASDEKNMILIAVALMLIVVIPVFILTFVFAYKYRASNVKAKYTPEWAHSTILEVIWWVIPCIIIVILGTLTWITSHTLDPYKPLDSKVKPITIQVVALDWKWLFIYPEENIATVNFVQFPDHVPINLKITADAPMNSIWIPQLGGQIYAMTGMQTKLHLFATEIGDYDGVSASFSGPGFSGMKFIARVTSESDYRHWVDEVKKSNHDLSMVSYNELAKPSENNKVEYYSTVANKLYDDIMMKFMMPMDNNSSMGGSNMETSAHN